MKGACGRGGEGHPRADWLLSRALKLEEAGGALAVVRESVVPLMRVEQRAQDRHPKVGEAEQQGCRASEHGSWATVASGRRSVNLFANDLHLPPRPAF